ncbi:YhcN/YlaJ family sporulation lipoprotein [Ammoniphilus sp. 3BR4]|uniref:YhcN/YlaJ family sporulation lipoprotein n=1 Tax=Ammoniphilus sp. 3BR4 TaxID=3158265 RepID=UPI00346566F9
MKAYIKTLFLSGLMAGLCACTGNIDGMEPQMHNRLGADIEENGMLSARDQALDLGHGHVGHRPTSYDANDAHALRIADLADDTPGVARSSSIVYGEDIVVGIQVRNFSESTYLEQKVKRLIQEREPGYNIYVTSNNQMNERIRAITENAANSYAQSERHHQPQRDIETEISNIKNVINKMNTDTR